MRHPQHRSSGTIATAVVLLIAIATFALYPVQAFGRIPPDHVDPARTGTDSPSATITVASPWWTYAVVAAVALVAGIALAHFAPQLRWRRLPGTA